MLDKPLKTEENDVFSDTYDNKGWSKRDDLPTQDPIGDIDEGK